MKKSKPLEEIIGDAGFSLNAPCIGRLAGTNQKRDILVEYEDYGPQPAKLIAGIDRKTLMRPENTSREVLLVFEKGDPRRPIIIGLMEDPLESLISFDLEPEATQANDFLVDGKRITIEADEEIVLKCGQGSILIRKDGKIVIKGTDLLSRSSGAQRIKGARVNIN
jgi:hypothetical protein